MSHSSLLKTLFHYKAWSNEELFSTVKMMDATAHADDRHLAIRIMNHIYVVDRIFEANLQGKAHTYTATNTRETPTLEELLESVRKTDAWYIAYVADLSPSALAESLEFNFTDGGRGTMSREEMLAHVITHGGYHRGAVGRILAQLSITPPRDVYTRYLHDAEPARRGIA